MKFSYWYVVVHKKVDQPEVLNLSLESDFLSVAYHTVENLVQIGNSLMGLS